MKMSDVFKNPQMIGSYERIILFVGGKDIGEFDRKEQAEAAAHAINNHDKLVEALQAAMNYIKECPCDPDIYPEQLEAWNELQSLNVKELTND